MRKIVVATNNEGKIKEIQEILKEVECITLKQIHYTEEIVEDGNTFEENAVKKVDQIAKVTGMSCLADDSGIEIIEYNRMARGKNCSIFRRAKSKQCSCKRKK